MNRIIVGSKHEKIIIPDWVLINGTEVFTNEMSVDFRSGEFALVRLTLPVQDILTVPWDNKELYLQLREALRLNDND